MLIAEEGEGDVGPDGKPRENYVPAAFEEGQAAFDARAATHGGSGLNFGNYKSIPVKAS